MTEWNDATLNPSSLKRSLRYGFNIYMAHNVMLKWPFKTAKLSTIQQALQFNLWIQFPGKPCILNRSIWVMGNSGYKWHVVGQHPWESLQLTVPLLESYLGTNTARSWEEALVEYAGPQVDRNVSLQMENVHNLLVKLSLKDLHFSHSVFDVGFYLAHVFLCLHFRFANWTYLNQQNLMCKIQSILPSINIW